MTNCFAWVLLIGLGLGAAAAAAEPSRIELRDGSIISGEVVGFSDGRYLVQSATLGRITVDESQIQSLRPGGAAPRADGYGAQITNLQQQMMGNAEIMDAITALQSDPQVQAALADPEFMGLVASGNLGALQDNPRFQTLMNSPALRSLQQRMTAQ